MISILLHKPILVLGLNLGFFVSVLNRFFHYNFSSKLFSLPGHNSVTPQILNAFRLCSNEYRIDPLLIQRPTDTYLILAYYEWLDVISKTNVSAKTIVGPNFCLLPSEVHSHTSIDRISSFIVPSMWVKFLYEEDLKKRHLSRMPHLHVWPSPVSSSVVDQRHIAVSHDEKSMILYLKLSSFALYKKEIAKIYQLLSKYTTLVSIVEYGSYLHSDYIRKLGQSTTMVILTDTTESQCIAQFEAWSLGVPTLTKSVTNFKADSICYNEASSSPWCLPDLGATWTSTHDLEQQIPKYLALSKSDVISSYDKYYSQSRLNSMLIRICS